MEPHEEPLYRDSVACGAISLQAYYFRWYTCEERFFEWNLVLVTYVNMLAGFIKAILQFICIQQTRSQK